jgi:hypothetical protein
MRDYRTAVERLDPIGIAPDAAILLGDLADAAELGSLAFVEALMSHHELIQANKPPGKRPWFERSERGFYVRSPYRLEDRLAPGYIHPYRIQAIRGFLSDLR